jgi:hypothetical protein
MSRKLIVILFFVLLALAALILFLSESYPAVLVNWRPVSLDSFNKESAAAIHYYQKVSEVYGESSSIQANSPEFQKEIHRAVLEKIIENKIVEDALEGRLEKGELKDIIAKKISDTLASGGNEMKEKVMTIYGISMADFQKEILEPQARLEVLQGRLILENNSADFESWLNSFKAGEKVAILVPGFLWKDGKVSISE